MTSGATGFHKPLKYTGTTFIVKLQERLLPIGPPVNLELWRNPPGFLMIKHICYLPHRLPGWNRRISVMREGQQSAGSAGKNWRGVAYG